MRHTRSRAAASAYYYSRDMPLVIEQWKKNLQKKKLHTQNLDPQNWSIAV